MASHHKPRPCILVVDHDPVAFTVDIEFTTGKGQNNYPYAAHRYLYRYTLPNAETLNDLLANTYTAQRFVDGVPADYTVLQGLYFNDYVRRVFPFVQLAN